MERTVPKSSGQGGGLGKLWLGSVLSSRTLALCRSVTDSDAGQLSNRSMGAPWPRGCGRAAAATMAWSMTSSRALWRHRRRWAGALQGGRPQPPWSGLAAPRWLLGGGRAGGDVAVSGSPGIGEAGADRRLYSGRGFAPPVERRDRLAGRWSALTPNRRSPPLRNSGEEMGRPSRPITVDENDRPGQGWCYRSCDVGDRSRSEGLRWSKTPFRRVTRAGLRHHA